MSLLDNENQATTGQKIGVRSKQEDPRYFQANELLRQIGKLKADRTALLKQADQYRERIDTLEAQFHKIVLELEPTEIVSVRKPSNGSADLVKRLQKEIASKLADSPSLEEQLQKILDKMS